MKIRKGFISNSSSTAFIITNKIDEPKRRTVARKWVSVINGRIDVDNIIEAENYDEARDILLGLDDVEIGCNDYFDAISIEEANANIQEIMEELSCKNG